MAWIICALVVSHAVAAYAGFVYSNRLWIKQRPAKRSNPYGASEES